MAGATVEDVFDHARARLADVERDGGEVFTNDRIRPAFNQAWRSLISKMREYQVPPAERTKFLILPAYTTRLHPSLFGMDDLGEIKEMWERPAPATQAISAATQTSPIDLTVASTAAYGTNQACIVSQVGGQAGANGRFFIEVVNGTTLRLKGSKSGGVYTSGGYIAPDEGLFLEMFGFDKLPQHEPTDRLYRYEQTDSWIEFRGCAQDVQIKLVYLSSGAAPVTGDLGYDDLMMALALETARVAAASSGDNKHKAFAQYIAPESAAEIDSFLNTQVRKLQNEVIQPRMYGRRDVKGLPMLRTGN